VWWCGRIKKNSVHTTSHCISSASLLQNIRNPVLVSASHNDEDVNDSILISKYHLFSGLLDFKGTPNAF
jgi:hypothetical protein